ncbi:hypothetical protein [Kribbella swartbergensis]
MSGSPWDALAERVERVLSAPRTELQGAVDGFIHQLARGLVPLVRAMADGFGLEVAEARELMVDRLRATLRAELDDDPSDPRD